MSKLLLFILLSFFSFEAVSQAGLWTWMKGDSTANSPGVFGGIGIADSLNKPPGLYEAAEFKDSVGNFWLFGGVTLLGEFNSLWKYDPLINQWTWMKGSNMPSQQGNYGVQGIPSPSNNPGARGWGAASWTDENGDFWLFGGFGYGSNGYGYLNDLWKYDVSTNEWTWMSGTSIVHEPGVYGIQTVASPANRPGSRGETNASWLDGSYNLWLFGGYSFQGYFNDMWKFDRSTNEWTWMKGASVPDQVGVYGTLGVSNVNNTPGSRGVYTKWKDTNGDFWVFAGLNLNLLSHFNDVWKYSVSSNEWTWMSGTNIANDTGSTSSNCDPGLSNIPSARFENRAVWNDCTGHLWTFGGALNNGIAYAYSDLWTFNSDLLEWTRVEGNSASNQAGLYGTQGVPTAFTYPRSRFGALGWIDDSCHLWLFGGNPAAPLNDLWKFTPDPSCPENLNCISNCDLPQFITTSNKLCEKFCTDFMDASVNNPTAWHWQFPGGDPSSSTDQNPANICYNVPGTYDVTLITTHAGGTDTLTLSNHITVNATPPFPTITQNGYTLTSSPAYSYQWQLNAADIQGATNQSYIVMQSGYYTVIVSDSNGCVNSESQYVLISGVGDQVNAHSISIFPNPARDQITIQSSTVYSNEMTSLSIVNILGQVVLQQKIIWKDYETLDVHDLPSGMYLVTIENEKQKLVAQFIKE